MKISELIKILTKEQKKLGNIRVLLGTYDKDTSNRVFEDITHMATVQITAIDNGANESVVMITTKELRAILSKEKESFGV